MNTRQLVYASFRALGTVAEGETPSDDMVNTGVECLNMLLDSMSAEELLPFDKVQRQIPLVANKKVYVIGDGVVFDEDQIGTASATDTSFTIDTPVVFDVPRQIVFTPAADESTNTFVCTGTNQRGEIITEDVPGAGGSVPSYSEKLFKTVTAITMSALAGNCTAGSAPITRTTRPIRIESGCFVRTVAGVDTPVLICSRERYAEKENKNTAGTPTALFYDKQYPTGVIWLYPRPDDGTQEMFIEMWQPFKHVSTTDLSEIIFMPGEYLLALKWNLAVELAPEYGRMVQDYVFQKSRESMNIIRAANGKPVVPLAWTTPKEIVQGQPAESQV